MAISVVIPTCNRNDSLCECLDGLASTIQAVESSKLEVIVTDDSNPGSAKELIESKFPWARWYAGPRKGPAANRNAGVRHASGQWLAFIDDDCIPSPQWLSAIVGASQNASVIEGRTTCEQGISHVMEEAPINEGGGNLWSCNFAIRRDLFDAVGGFDEGFPFPSLEDVDFHHRVKAAEIPITFCPEAVVDHPPRRRKTGRKAAAMWESRVYFEHKHSRKVPCSKWLPLHVLKVRLRQAIASSKSLETIPAVTTALVESAIVAVKVRGWDRKYSGPSKQQYCE